MGKRNDLQKSIHSCAARTENALPLGDAKQTNTSEGECFEAGQPQSRVGSLE